MAVGEMTLPDVEDVMISWRRYPTERQMIQAYLGIKDTGGRQTSKEEVDKLLAMYGR